METDLYAHGERLYRDKHYPQALQVFRQLAGRLPPDDLRGRARASYSVGLCLMHLSDTDGAREAFVEALSHDPALERAEQRLAQLDQQAATTQGVDGHTVGTAHHVRMSVTPHPIIATARIHTLQFRLHVPGWTEAPAVTLRGPRILGSINDGDVVAVPDGWHPDRPVTHVLNLTSGETVRAARAVHRLQVAVLVVFLAVVAAFILYVFTQAAA